MIVARTSFPDGSVTVSCPLYEAQRAVIAAARSGDDLLVKLALAELDRTPHGGMIVTGEGPPYP